MRLQELADEERKARQTLGEALRATVPDPARAQAVMSAADSWRRASLRLADAARTRAEQHGHQG